MLRKLIVGTACALLLGGLAGCGPSGGQHATTSTAAGQGGSVQQQALSIWREFVRCVRSHGVPNFPDVQVDDHGQAQIGGSGQPSPARLDVRVQRACGSILRRLPASANANPPPSATDLRHLRQYAACLRQHGIPNWPDPRPDGSFPLSGTPLAAEGKSPRFLAADRPCQQYWSGRVRSS
jgi:hypothetical protein